MSAQPCLIASSASDPALLPAPFERRPLPRGAEVTPITALTARLGLTSRALRHYEAIGLIVSNRDWGGIRHYSATTVEAIELIVQLRTVDICLADIRSILSRTAPEDRAALTQDILRRVARERLSGLQALERLIAAGPTVEDVNR